MIAVFRILTVLALVYEAVIIFRVVDGWVGIIMAIIAIVLLPISVTVVAITMFFIPSSAAGPLALWPAAAFIAFLEWVAQKQNRTLLIK